MAENGKSFWQSARTNGLFRLETKIYLAEMKPLQKLFTWSHFML